MHGNRNWDRGGFIFGDTAETLETANETLNYWAKETQGQLYLFFIQPYPGSEIYNRAVEKGIIKDKMHYIKNQIYKTNFFNMTDSMSDTDFNKLIKKVMEFRAKYCNYVPPKELIKEKENTYEVVFDCPFCKKENRFKNCYLANKKFYANYTLCRHCMKKLYVCSPIYKLYMDNYLKFDFLRKGYLFLKNRLGNKKI